MIRWLRLIVGRLRTRRWCHLVVVNLRILLGFAFVPAGLKKVLYQPFTNPRNTGAFHDFLDAFYATGAFYQFVGWVQLLAAVLLMTQSFATLGTLVALPIVSCITVFCWSTGVVPTATVVTLMLAGHLALLAWDFDRWLPLLAPEATPASAGEAVPRLDRSLWSACGAGILVVYGVACLAYGGVYRPKGVDLDQPAFYVLLLVALFPVVTWVVEHRRRARSVRSDRADRVRPARLGD